MDAIRKQLDQLMGANRNGDVLEVSRKYYDRDVCRLYLAGLCPHDLFQLTRALKRLEEEDAKAAIAISVTEVTQTKEVMELSKLIRQKMKDIDAFEGKIPTTEELDKLKEQRAEEQTLQK
nr:unnamed protein product [Digitaria exilis]